MILFYHSSCQEETSVHIMGLIRIHIVHIQGMGSSISVSTLRDLLLSYCPLFGVHFSPNWMVPLKNKEISK